MADHLLKEVDDALKWQRLQQLWQRAGQQIILGVAVVVIALIALLIYRQQTQEALQAQSDQLLNASALVFEQNADALAQASDTFADMKDASGAHAQIADLFRASIQFDKGETQSALELLKQAQNQPEGEPLLAQYACLQSYGFSEKAAPCKLDQDFALLQGEMAIMKHLQAGQVAEAYQQLQLLGDPVDPMQRQRLEYVSAYIRSSLHHALPNTNTLPGDASHVQSQP